MILYNTLLYQHIHPNIRLTELKALNQYFTMKTDFLKTRFVKSNSLLNRFSLMCLSFATVTIILVNIQIRWSFRENSQILVAVFKAPAKKPSNSFIFRARGVFRRLTVIKWAPLDSGHITNSQFCNYILKLSLRSLLSNLHQRIRFSQWQLSSAANMSMKFQLFKEVVIISFGDYFCLIIWLQ